MTAEFGGARDPVLEAFFHEMDEELARRADVISERLEGSIEPARPPAVVPIGVDEGGGQRGSVPGGRAGRRGVPWIGLAVAASLAALLIGLPERAGLDPAESSRSSGDLGSTLATEAVADRAAETMSFDGSDRLTVRADGPFAVFPTRNPDISVIWMFNRGGEE